eukprot:749769-Hanusia_phi.AAC.2
MECHLHCPDLPVSTVLFISDSRSISACKETSHFVSIYSQRSRTHSILSYKRQFSPVHVRRNPCEFILSGVLSLLLLLGLLALCRGLVSFVDALVYNDSRLKQDVEDVQRVLCESLEHPPPQKCLRTASSAALTCYANIAHTQHNLTERNFLSILISGDS